MTTFANRVRVATPTLGTGILTLGAPSTGYLSFPEGGVPDGSTVSYCIEDGSNIEGGVGTYNASTGQMTRSVIFSKVNGSSSGIAPLSLTGSATVFLTLLAE